MFLEVGGGTLEELMGKADCKCCKHSIRVSLVNSHFHLLSLLIIVSAVAGNDED